MQPGKGVCFVLLPRPTPEGIALLHNLRAPHRHLGACHGVVAQHGGQSLQENVHDVLLHCLASGEIISLHSLTTRYSLQSSTIECHAFWISVAAAYRQVRASRQAHRAARLLHQQIGASLRCHMQRDTCSCAQLHQAKMVKQRWVRLSCTPGGHLAVALHWEQKRLLQSRPPWGLRHQHAPGQPFPRLPEEAAGVSPPCQEWAAAAVASHATALRTPPAAFLHPWVAGECVTSPPLRAGVTPRQSWVGDPQPTQSKEASTRINYPPSMSSWGACVSCACQMTHWKRGSEPG